MRLASLLAVLLLLGVGSGAAVGSSPSAGGALSASSDVVASAPPPDGAPAVEGAVPLQVESDGPAQTELRIALQSDGDAAWTVRMRYGLGTENRTRAFETLRRQFEEGDAEATMGRVLFDRAAAAASEGTGREMTIRNVTREGRIENGTGTLTLSFVWTNFLASTDDGGLELSDAFRTGDGYWLSSLNPGQRLIVETPPGYTIDTNPGFPYQNDSVVIDGPREFSTDGDQRLHFEYQPIQNGTPPGGGGLPQGVLVGGLALVVLLIAAVAVLLARRDDEGTPQPGTDADTAAAGRDADSATGAGGDAGSEPNVDEATATPVDETPDDGVDPELLSDEERVEYLLERSGGRMKQATIVEETGWSDAKVSQLLSSMADDDRVDKLRLGRENLISLPDEDGAGDEE